MRLRVRHRAELREVLRECLSGFTSEECVALLGSNQIVVGAVRAIATCWQSPDVAGSGILVDASARMAQAYRALGLPYRLGDAPRAIARRCARLRRGHRQGAGRGRLSGSRSPRCVAPAWSHESMSIPTSTGCDAVIQTLPLFEMMRMRAATTARRHPRRDSPPATRQSRLRWVNQFTHTHRKLGPGRPRGGEPEQRHGLQQRLARPVEGPVVIETPDMGDRYWTLGLLDAWTNPVRLRRAPHHRQPAAAHAGAWARLAGQGAGRHDAVIAAPGRTCGSSAACWWTRRRATCPRAGAAARRCAAPPGRQRRRDARGHVARCKRGRCPPAPLYASVVGEALARNPVPDGEPSAGRRRRGAGNGAAARLRRLRTGDQPHALGGGWALPVAVRTHWGDDLLTRARIARNFIGALGVEEAMYPTAEVDARGAPLDGSPRYELRFPPGGGPRVGAFWSLTMYRRSDCLFVANPIGRYSIGDRTPGLRADADGSLAIRLQADDPGPGCNWLPGPGGRTVLRRAAALPAAA
jgi:hypothetical protein